MGNVKTSERVRVLMTGAGAPGGPGIIQCLKADSRIELVVGDTNPKASGRFLNDKFVELRAADDNLYIQHLLSICNDEKIDVIFPLVTKELLKISMAVSEFDSIGVKVLISPRNGLDISNDKIKLYRHLESNKIPVPRFKVASNLKQLIEAAESLGYPEVPIVMKPGISNGSRGIRILDEKKDRFSLLFQEKPTGIFSTLSEVIQIIDKNNIPPLLVSEYLPGNEVTVDTILTKDHRIACLLQRVRDKMNGGISVAGHFIENPKIKKYIEDILGTMKLFGPIGIQIKEDSTGEYRILEINPRIQGTSVAANGLGINLPITAISALFDWPIPKKNIKKNIGFVRYYTEAYYDY